MQRIILFLKCPVGKIKPSRPPSLLLLSMQSNGGECVFITLLCECVEALTVLRGNFHFLLAYESMPWQLGVRACASQRQASQGGGHKSEKAGGSLGCPIYVNRGPVNPTLC